MNRRWVSARELSCLLGVLLVVGVATGCSSDPLADSSRDDHDTTFTTADGFQSQELSSDERSEPVDFKGELDTGGSVTARTIAVGSPSSTSGMRDAGHVAPKRPNSKRPQQR